MCRVEGHKIVRTIPQQSAKCRKDWPATAVARAEPRLDGLDAHGACARSRTRYRSAFLNLVFCGAAFWHMQADRPIGNEMSMASAPRQESKATIRSRAISSLPGPAWASTSPFIH